MRGFTALTLWMIHPALYKAMRHASMEVSSESTENGREFCILGNSMFSEIKGKGKGINLI